MHYVLSSNLSNNISYLPKLSKQTTALAASKAISMSHLLLKLGLDLKPSEAQVLLKSVMALCCTAAHP